GERDQQHACECSSHGRARTQASGRAEDSGISRALACRSDTLELSCANPCLAPPSWLPLAFVASLAPVAKDEPPAILTIDGREVRVTHPSKLYFSREARLTKRELVEYYLSVAAGALLGIRDRPIVLKRFVNGAEGEAFYQKRAPDKRPEWLRTV